MIMNSIETSKSTGQLVDIFNNINYRLANVTQFSITGYISCCGMIGLCMLCKFSICCNTVSSFPGTSKAISAILAAFDCSKFSNPELFI